MIRGDAEGFQQILSPCAGRLHRALLWVLTRLSARLPLAGCRSVGGASGVRGETVNR
jgi:hypothetical protein